MQLPAARSLIQRCCERMKSLYGEPVFDEWLILLLMKSGGTIAAYEGARAAQVKERLLADTHMLKQVLRDQPLSVGQFAFAPAASGTSFDACVRVSEGGYLLFNHTQRTMEQIRAHEAWLAAQRPFVELCEAFAQDPLE